MDARSNSDDIHKGEQRVKTPWKRSGEFSWSRMWRYCFHPGLASYAKQTSIEIIPVVSTQAIMATRVLSNDALSGFATDYLRN